MLVEGSFNWLSASREPGRGRYEVSVVLSDETAPGHIHNLVLELNQISSVGKKTVLNPDLKVEGEVLLEVSASDEEDVGEGWGSFDKDEFRLEMMPETAAFFGQKYFNTLLPGKEEIFKQTVRDWGIGKKENLPGDLLEIRKEYPRHMERWSNAEWALFDELLQKTNSLEVLVRCLQRKPSAIAGKVNEWLLKEGNK